jgi:hypothetical protein
LTYFRKRFFRDCPKRVTSNTPSVDSTAIKRAKWVTWSFLGDL